VEPLTFWTLGQKNTFASGCHLSLKFTLTSKKNFLFSTHFFHTHYFLFTYIVVTPDTFSAVIIITSGEMKIQLNEIKNEN